MAVTLRPSPAVVKFLSRVLWLAGLIGAPAWAQSGPPAPAGPACSAQPSYPLPTGLLQLQTLADRLEVLSQQAGCLADARFHAWRGAVLMALGRPGDAVAPLERALLADPDLPGAQLDLAQALALEGDPASAFALLQGLRQRGDLPQGLAGRLDRALASLGQPGTLQTAPLSARWLIRWQLSSLAGVDSNLNNGPASSEITLTLPQGDVTLPLDPSSRPKQGPALVTTAQWQGLKPQGNALWALQAELRARQTQDSDTSYQQADLSASWLQAPLAPRQWVVRAATSQLRFGGADLLRATRLSLQHQWQALQGPGPWLLAAGCRPSATAELEHRRYPRSSSLDGLYQGAGLGLLCRPAGQPSSVAAATASGGAVRANGASAGSFFSVQARLGQDRPFDDNRAGGVYRRAELRVQWETPVFGRARLGLQGSSTRQADSEPYSVLLGNVARRTLRHALQVEMSWPLAAGWSLVGSADGAWQRSNIPAFASRQRSVYLGLRWELM